MSSPSKPVLRPAGQKLLKWLARIPRWDETDQTRPCSETLYHTLHCGHRVTTKTVQPCAPNCRSRPRSLKKIHDNFLCPAYGCVDRVIGDIYSSLEGVSAYEERCKDIRGFDAFMRWWDEFDKIDRGRLRELKREYKRTGRSCKLVDVKREQRRFRSQFVQTQVVAAKLAGVDINALGDEGEEELDEEFIRLLVPMTEEERAFGRARSRSPLRLDDEADRRGVRSPSPYFGRYRQRSPSRGRNTWGRIRHLPEDLLTSAESKAEAKGPNEPQTRDSDAGVKQHPQSTSRNKEDVSRSSRSLGSETNGRTRLPSSKSTNEQGAQSNTQPRRSERANKGRRTQRHFVDEVSAFEQLEHDLKRLAIRPK